jgi:hypothetical protein
MEFSTRRILRKYSLRKWKTKKRISLVKGSGQESCVMILRLDLFRRILCPTEMSWKRHITDGIGAISYMDCWAFKVGDYIWNGMPVK